MQTNLAQVIEETIKRYSRIATKFATLFRLYTSILGGGGGGGLLDQKHAVNKRP